MNTKNLVNVFLIAGIIFGGELNIATAQTVAPWLKTYSETISYDVAGRLTGITYNDLDELSYGYDDAGNISKYSATVVTLTTVEGTSGLPRKFELHANYPNPFNPTTTIKYDIPQQTRVRVEVFDVRGLKVATLLDQEQPIGYYEFTWTARSEVGAQIGSGIYLLRMTAGDFRATQRIILLK